MSPSTPAPNSRPLEPRVQVTLQMPQTLYQAVERLTRQGERHAFLLNIIQQDPAVAKTVLALQAEAAERARFEELGRKAAEQGLLTPGT